MLITWLLLRGARESATANNIMVVIKLMALGAVRRRRRDASARRRTTRRSRRTASRGIHQGAAIVFFAYIGFDAISTAAEETQEPAAQPADRHPRRPRHLHADLRHRRRRADRHGAVQGARGRRSAGARARARRLHHGRLDRRARRGGLDVGRAAGVPVRPAAHLLRDGARRAAAEVGRAPEPASRKVPSTTTIITGLFVASWALIGDAGETYDLTNIGTLFAFMLVSIGVLVLRYKEPDRPRPFRVPFVVAGLRAVGRRLPVHHVRPAAHGVGAVRLVAGDRPRAVLLATASATASCARTTRDYRRGRTA